MAHYKYLGQYRKSERGREREMAMYASIAPSASGFGEYERVLGSERNCSTLKRAAEHYSDYLTDVAIPARSLDGQHDITDRVVDAIGFEKVYAIPDGYGTYEYFGRL